MVLYIAEHFQGFNFHFIQETVHEDTSVVPGDTLSNTTNG